MDSLASLALATEPPTAELLERPPYSRDEYIISKTMVKHLSLMGIWQILILYSIVFAGEHFIPDSDMFWRFYSPWNPYVYPRRL